MSEPKTPVIGHVMPLPGKGEPIEYADDGVWDAVKRGSSVKTYPPAMLDRLQVDMETECEDPNPFNRGPWCENCGDAFDGPERHCPYPSPGEPLKQCGRGGHMFTLEAKPTVVLAPGMTWACLDGTMYDVVAADDVGDRPRWWIDLATSNDRSVWEPASVDDLHDIAASWSKARFALVTRAQGEPVSAADKLPADSLFSLEGARELLDGTANVAEEDYINGAHDEIRTMLREACDEVERLGIERADLMAYINDAKRAAGERRVSGEPLSETVARMATDLAQARATIETMRLAADQEAERVRAIERRVDHGGKITADLYALAAKLGANLPKPEARYAEDAVLRVQHGVSDLQKAHAKAERSRKRWEARARKAEERVEALTVERDDANQRVARKVAGQVRRKAKRKAGAKGGRR